MGGTSARPDGCSATNATSADYYVEEPDVPDIVVARLAYRRGDRPQTPFAENDLKSNIQVSVLAAGQCVLCYAGGQLRFMGDNLVVSFARPGGNTTDGTTHADAQSGGEEVKRASWGTYALIV
jgi:hypothetical protein